MDDTAPCTQVEAHGQEQRAPADAPADGPHRGTAVATPAQPVKFTSPEPQRCVDTRGGVRVRVPACRAFICSFILLLGHTAAPGRFQLTHCADQHVHHHRRRRGRDTGAGGVPRPGFDPTGRARRPAGPLGRWQLGTAAPARPAGQPLVRGLLPLTAACLRALPLRHCSRARSALLTH